MKTPSLKVDAHISLHLPRLEFADLVFQLIEQQKPYLREWLNWIDNVKSIHSIKAQIREAIALNNGGQRLSTYIFYDLQLVGAVSFVKIDSQHRKAEMGYWISKDFQGQGIVTKSCLRLIQYGFKHLNINKISLKITSDNYKSLAIAQRLGFQSEGLLRQDIFWKNKFHDVYIYSLFSNKKEFEQKN